MFGNLPLKFRPPGRELPTETRATCSSCVLAKPDWPRDARDPGPFERTLKCCTYFPFLPNFTIGRLLRESGHESRLAEAAKRGVMTPLGLVPDNGRSESGNFGREMAERCPFLSGGCTIWNERPSVCRSYFCVSDQGAAGQAKWAAAEKLGNEIEWTLAHEILWELGFTADDIATRSWMEWRGREHDFYLRCAALSETLEPAEPIY